MFTLSENKISKRKNAFISNEINNNNNVNNKFKTINSEKPILKRRIAQCFNDFATNTSMHGYYHIVRTDASTFEK